MSNKPTEKLRSPALCPLLASVSLAAALAAPQALAQKIYATPEAAAAAFVDALATMNTEEMRSVLGADWKRYIPTGTYDQDDVYGFLRLSSQGRRIVSDSAARAHLAVGPEGWTLPIPIVKRGGGWAFDPKAGAQEIRTRRIGRNELDAIQAALTYVEAQKEYAQVDRDDDGVADYAEKIVSTPGRKDGLYWGVLPGEPESPLGPFFAGDFTGSDGYHGYRFKVLKAQGPSAAGGAKSYLVNGRMTGGFALVAWPAKYGETGVKSFLVNQDGQVYEKDLGPKSDAIARPMTRFDPDAGWDTVAP